MTRVRFLHLEEGEQVLAQLLTRLLAEARDEELDILVHTGDEGLARALALHLPRQSGASPTLTGVAPAAPFSISWADHPGDHHGLLVNFTPQVPPWFGRFRELVEVIGENGPHVAHKRQNYRFFRHRGYPLRYENLLGPGEPR